MSVPSSNAKYNWLMNGKTIDNVNEALAPTSDITTANVTYLREDYTVKVDEPHYTEDNVIPLVDAEYGYALHTITVGDHSEVIYVNTVSGTKSDNKIQLPANTFIRSSGCVFDSDTTPVFRIFAVATEKVMDDGSIDANLLFYKVEDFNSSGGVSPIKTRPITGLIDGAGALNGSKLHFSTQLIVVDPSRISCIRSTGFSPASKSAGTKKAILVGVSAVQDWDLDMRNTKNNDIKLEVKGEVKVPISVNDVVYTDKQALASSYDGLKWTTNNVYKQGSSSASSMGVYVKSGSDIKTSTTTLYNYINNSGIEKDEFGHLLCLDATCINGASSSSEPVYTNLGNRIWSIRTAPVGSTQTDSPLECECDEDGQMTLDDTYFLQANIYDTSNTLQKQTHILITNVMKPTDIAVGFETENKSPEHCRIFPGDINALTTTTSTTDSTYVAWVRRFVKADTKTVYSDEKSDISFFSPIVAATSEVGAFVNATGNGCINGVEIVDQAVVTYSRDKATGEYQYTSGDYSEVLVFAKLSDVLNKWDAVKMAGQGAGRSNLSDGLRLNSPFTESFILKDDVTIESSLTYSTGTAIRFQITDMFSKGLFVFCYVNTGDNLSNSELNALNFRGAGVTGMPVIDIDDASVKFGTGRFNQILMDQVFLENCEKLRHVTVGDAWCFDASHYCGYYTAGEINIASTGSTLCNVDNLELNKQYNQNTLNNLFTGGVNSVYNVNIGAQSKRALEYHYNSICSAKLFQRNVIYNPTLTADVSVELMPLSSNGIRIWNALTSTGFYLSFNLDNDNLEAGATDHKRIPINNIANRVALTYPQYHEITSGSHIHYNIANQCTNTGKATNYISVFTKGGCVGFYESTSVKTPKAIFMCAVPLVDDASNPLSVGTGSIGGVKFGTVADQFFVYALCPNLAGLSLAMDSTPSGSITSPSAGISGGSTSASQVLLYEESYIIAYDLNAISSPPAGVPAYTTIPGTNIYNDRTAPYIVAYLADTGKKYLAGTLTAANNLLIVPTGSYSTHSVVRLYRKTDIVRSNANGDLDAAHGMIWAPIYDLLPAFQILYGARSITGVTVSGNSLFIQGGLSPATKADFKNTVGAELSNSFRTITLEL